MIGDLEEAQKAYFAAGGIPSDIPDRGINWYQRRTVLLLQDRAAEGEAKHASMKRICNNYVRRLHDAEGEAKQLRDTIKHIWRTYAWRYPKLAADLRDRHARLCQTERGMSR